MKQRKKDKNGYDLLEDWEVEEHKKFMAMYLPDRGEEEA